MGGFSSFFKGFTKSGTICDNKPKLLECVFRFLAVAIAVVFVLLPCPYLIQAPGTTYNVLQTDNNKEIIKIEYLNTHPTDGKLLLTTVAVYGNRETYLPPALALYYYFNKSYAVIPIDAIFEQGETEEQQDTEDLEHMNEAKSSAIEAVKHYFEYNAEDENGALAKDMEGIADSIKDANIELQIDGVGGPSAGLVFSLGIVNKLSGLNFVAGNTVAATGAISSSGVVGPIGGIRQKMVAVKRDGATVFLIPGKNCRDALNHIPDGLNVVPVSTLAESVDILKRIKDKNIDDLPVCSVDK